MKKNNKKRLNLDIEVQRFAVRVLLIVCMLGSGSLEGALAVSKPSPIGVAAFGALLLGGGGSLQVLNSENTQRGVMDNVDTCKQKLNELYAYINLGTEYEYYESFLYGDRLKNAIDMLVPITNNITASINVTEPIQQSDNIDDNCKAIDIDILYANDKILCYWGGLIKDFCNECDCPSTILLRCSTTSLENSTTSLENSTTSLENNTTSLENNTTMPKTILIQEEEQEYTYKILECHLSCDENRRKWNLCIQKETTCDQPKISLP